MAQRRKFEYMEIDPPTGGDPVSIKIKHVKDFIKLAEAAKVQFIFKTADSKKKDDSCFLLLLDKVIYKLNTANYEALVDYEDALENEFPSAEDYYAAKKGNFSSWHEYEECRKSGITDNSVFLEAKKLGFVSNFDDFIKKTEESKTILPENYKREDCDSAIKLYQCAIDNGFKDYGDFKKAFFLGFADQATYNDAKSKGFSYAEDYIEAVKMGFDKIKEYQEARHLEMKNKYEYDKYDELRKLAKDLYSFDQVQLIQALKNFETPKKLPVKKIRELLARQQGDLFISDDARNKKLPGWYTQKLETDDALIAFLSKTEELKGVGLFDEEGEYFEVSKKLSNSKIYVDGNNIAYENQRKRENPKADDKPRFSNIKLVVEELQSRGYKDIVVIADPGLKRKAPDNQVLQQLIGKDKITFHQAPSNTEADEFLIKNAKKDACYIITNDTFRDWKVKDIWMAENIDRIRKPFMITDGKVTFSGLD